jgi:hypothetical protein
MVYYEDECDGTWEPFVGRMQSPNPDYPQVIENTMDCVEFEQGDISTTDGSYLSTTGYVRTKRFIPCVPGDIINVRTDIIKNIYINYFNDNGYISSDKILDANEITSTVPTGATKFIISIGKTIQGEAVDIITPDTVGKISLTVNGKYVGQIKNTGKNLLGGLAFANALEQSGAYTYIENATDRIVALHANNQTSHKKVFSNFKENTQYSFFLRGYNSESDYSLVTNIGIEYTDGTYEHIYFGKNKSHTVFVSKSDKSINRLRCSNFAGASYFYYEDFGIMEGVHTLEDFEPYTEKVATFYTDEPLRRHSYHNISDKLFKDTDGLFKIKRMIGEHVAKITTLIELSNGNKGAIVTPTDKTPVSYGGFLCDRSTFNQDAHTDGTFYENPVNFILVGSVDDTLETLQAKYNGAILTYYKTPTIETLDIVSQLSLNSLLTFKDVTYLESNSKVKPETVTVEYGITKDSSYTLKNRNDCDIDKVEREALKSEIEELKVALLATGSEE